jgi:hypothetical protein
MRRFSILLAFALVFGLLVVVAATAAAPDFCNPDKYGTNHPNCSTTTTTTPPTTTIPPPPTTIPPQFEDCVFDADGVLLGWPLNGEGYRCRWVLTEEQAKAEYSFQIQSTTVETVKLPQLTVNAEAWTPSAVCFNEAYGGRPTLLPFPLKGDDRWTFSPALSSWFPSAEGAKTCAEGGPYLFAIGIHQVKDGDVRLVMSPPGELIERPLDITEGS